MSCVHYLKELEAEKIMTNEKYNMTHKDELYLRKDDDEILCE